MSEHDDRRPNPDQLLTEVSRAAERQSGGRLKIFLGMVAGVGKTYAMLQEAHRLRAKGVDVVVGWIDTHGRRETAALLEGLELVPRRTVDYRGVRLEELDIDAVLKRRPSIVLVDELAHTNAPGSRHTKRYLDVLELLAAGIDVYTTINVQHMESRVGTVQEITGVPVRETVPDSVLDKADEVVLIDLPPEELLRRLKDGRIYPPERAEAASMSFFQQGNLTALREMALRLAAERVDRELRSFKVLHGIEGVWKSGSRLLVAIYASPYSEELIRWTRRLADLTDGTWLGVYVENEQSLSEEERTLLTRNIALIGELGGEFVTTRDVDPVSGILRAARQNNVTQIVVGKSQRGCLTNLMRHGSVVSRIIKRSGDIDVYVVAGDKSGARPGPRFHRPRVQPLPWEELGWLIAIILSVWLVAAGLESLIGYLAVGIIFLAAVSIAGLFLSRSSVLLLALVFGLIHNFFFIPPVNTFAISKPEDILTVAMYFLAAASLGHLTHRLKRKERVLQESEARAISLFNLSKGLAGAQSIDQIAAIGLGHLSQAFATDTALLLPGEGSDETLRVHPESSYVLDGREMGVAEWVKVHGKAAGRFTETLPAAKGLYLPLVSRDAVIAVVGIRVDGRSVFDSSELSLAETSVRQISAVLERERFHEQGRRFQVMEETQRLYKTLLDSVSHELKTPLATIQGSASALVDPATAARRDVVVALAGEIVTGTERLQRLVDQLLDMTRIESGMLKPKRDLCDVEDLIGSALRRVDPFRGDHPVHVTVAKGLPPVACDQVLLIQALINILHNAFVYAPGTSPVEISASTIPGSQIRVSIRDHGPGLPKDRPEQVLEKFFRGSPETTGGVGLGLSIALGFIELQGGRLTAANDPGGGAVFSILMPAGASDAS